MAESSLPTAAVAKAACPFPYGHPLIQRRVGGDMPPSQPSRLSQGNIASHRQGAPVTCMTSCLRARKWIAIPIAHHSGAFSRPLAARNIVGKPC